MNEEKVTINTTQGEIICKSCSSKLIYAPGTTKLKCEHCGAENEIVSSGEPIEELDFEKFISEYTSEAEKHDLVTVKCDACGAQTSFEANFASGNCPFCGSPIVVSSGTIHHSIQPQALLPFLIDKTKAYDDYANWLKNLWWAPDDLKAFAQQEGKLIGMYIPYWTYDANTNTSYIGERGEDFTETEEYEETNDNGDTVTQTRTIVRTVWYPVSGDVNCNFDDLLVIASQSLPKNITNKLEPWDLKNLTPFNPGYLSGYKAESYQIDLKTGFEEAKAIMDNGINESVLRNISGSHQRVFSQNTSYNQITFKHILLPVWINAYRYKDKVYRFLINGRTGDVHGERPYSWAKITIAILIAIAVIILVAVLV